MLCFDLLGNDIALGPPGKRISLNERPEISNDAVTVVAAPANLTAIPVPRTQAGTALDAALWQRVAVGASDCKNLPKKRSIEGVMLPFAVINHIIECALGLGSAARIALIVAPITACAPQQHTDATQTQPNRLGAMTAPVDTKAPTAIILLPADKATDVDPKLGRISLLLSEPMSEAPTGTLLLEIRDGAEWRPAAHSARGDYNAKTREWKWLLTPSTLPDATELRITIRPDGGKDIAGNAMDSAPIGWTFRTAGPESASQPRSLKGGCPVDEKPKPSKATLSPCDHARKP